MKAQRANRTNSLSMFRVAIQAMGLLVVVPTLVILMVFRNYITGENAPILIGLLVISFLGFYLLWRILRGMQHILAGLQDLSTGKLDRLDSDEDVGQLKEMASIVNSLNQLAEDFRENTAELGNLIQQFATLAEITEITARIPDINELLRLILIKAMASTHSRKGSVMLLREDGMLEIAAAEGWTPKDGAPVPLSEFIGKSAIDTGRPMLIEDIENSPLTRRANNSDRYTTSSFLIVPLKTKQSTIGVISLSDKATGRTFHVQDQQFVLVMVGQIGYAVENARLLKQARDGAANLKKTVQVQETQLQEAQLKLLQSQKLSALGQLAGGIAHDFNNLLQAILGYADLAMQKTQHENSWKHDLDMIKTASEKAAALTRQLLAFGRRQVLQQLDLSLGQVIQEVSKMLKRIIGEQVSLDIVQSSRKIVHIDPQQMEQVLLNLCINARDAMPGGGTITIETSDIKIDAKTPYRQLGAPPGSYVLLSVKDEGCGMDKEVLDHIFEPFFTTKEVGKGTGLGLATVYGIIHQHNGFLDVWSERGKGSIFKVLLPAATNGSIKPTVQRDPSDAGEIKVSGGHETILVAEDDALVRDLETEILQGAGYKVLTAADGQEAIDIFQAQSQHISLLLVDAIMPKKSGYEVCKLVRSIRSDIPVVFCSGYNTGDLPGQIDESAHLTSISKPVRANDLLQNVREALGGNGRT
mgnify:CR=1 FL=1